MTHTLVAKVGRVALTGPVLLNLALNCGKQMEDHKDI